ncbi:MAG: hypothetical protein DHS20C14_04110 [Phycisphaeraceae bacterium]|nr:MAG: hypothetical protein DHS20C14_04110 [Phycisphaeraceae bacterium]
MKTQTLGVAAALALAAAANADVLIVDITIGTPSGVDLELCQDLPIVGGCDSDASSISGTATFRVDTTAGTAQMIDFSVSTDESLDYTYTGLLSQVDASAPVVDLFYAGVADSAPAALGAGGAFTFPLVPVGIAGTAAVTGTILGAGSVDESIDFGDFGPFEADLTGTLTESAGVWTLSGSFSFDDSTVGDVMGITVTTTATGTLVLEGTGTGTPESCAGDCDGNGTLNVDDIDCFVTGFLGGDLGVADCDANGTLNVDDIDCYVTAFIAGCP